MRVHWTQKARFIRCGIGFLFLASLASLLSCRGEDLGGPGQVSAADLAKLDQTSRVVTFDNSRYGFHLNLDPEKKRLIDIFEGQPGEIRRSSFIQDHQLEILIDGRDFREFLVGAKGALVFEERDGVVPLLSKAPVKTPEATLGPIRDFQVRGELNGVSITLSLPLSGSIVGFRAMSESPHRALIRGRGGKVIADREFSKAKPLFAYFGQRDESRKLTLRRSIVLPVRLDGPAEDVAAVNGMAFRLLAARPLAPFGLTSERYGGHVFWDSDMWVFPSLCLVDPEGARRVAGYRVGNFVAAEAAAERWAKIDGRPVSGNKRMGAIQGFSGQPFSSGLKFPWESGKSGEEMGTTDARFQEHLTADVTWMLRHADALGYWPESKRQNRTSIEKNRRLDLDYFLKKTGDYYRHRMTLGEPFELKNTVSASEWHTVDNDLFTNSLLEVVYGFKMKLPRDETTFLSFDGDKLGEYQQAAALLAVFPVQHPGVEAEAGAMLDRFAGKTAAEGPAMSHSISATVAARLGRTEEAYEYWKKSWQLYTDDPLLRFREKAVSGDSYFYTGAAGCMNAVYYGFMGLRIDPFEPEGKAWKLELRNGFWLSAEPHLPSSWRSLEVDLFVLGKRYTLIATSNGLKVEPSSS